MRNNFPFLTLSMLLALGALVILNACGDDDEPGISFESDPVAWCLANPADSRCFTVDPDAFCDNNPLDEQCCIPSQDIDCYCSTGDNATTDEDNCCLFQYNPECFCAANPNDSQCENFFVLPEGAFVVQDFEGNVDDVLATWGATNDDNRSVDLSIQTGGPEGRYLEIIANDRTGTNAFVSQLEFLNTNLTIDDTVGLTLNFLINYDQDNDLPFGFHPIISDAYHVGDSIFYSGDEPEDYSPRRLARFFHFPSQEDGQSDWRVISIPVNTKSINWATWSNGPGLERGIWDFSFVKHLSFAVNLGGFTEAAEGTIGIDVIWFQKGTPDGATSILNQP